MDQIYILREKHNSNHNNNNKTTLRLQASSFVA